jgi:type II secretory pathway pseudopilin PulG
MNPITRHAARGEEGMTLVEVMVSMVLLLVGVLGVATMLNSGSRVTSDNLVRDNAMALAREQLERAREVPFASLSNVSNVGTKLTSVVPGASSGSFSWTTLPTVIPGFVLPSFIPAGTITWTLPTLATPLPAIKFTTTRQGTSFDSTVATCVLDDPSDGIGPATGSSCLPIPASSGGGGTVASAGGSTTLNVNVLGIQVTGSGALTDIVCSLLGTRGSLLDGLLGSGGLLGGLVSAGADTTFCAGKGNVAFDRQANDAVAITTLVTFKYPGTDRTGSVAQRVVVSGPRVSS